MISDPQEVSVVQNRGKETFVMATAVKYNIFMVIYGTVIPLRSTNARWCIAKFNDQRNDFNFIIINLGFICFRKTINLVQRK